jgi:UDP-2,4-diacetamido-2,4,6-trideoxy-beta-L-altropyranose hydrolase
MMKVPAITEGGQAVGFGHLTRCLALCQAFELRGYCTEFIVAGDDSVKSSGLLQGREFRVFDWKDKENKGKLLHVLKETDVVIVDSYLADKNLYKIISDEVHKAVFLDDTKRIDYPAGIVVNWSISAHELQYPEKEHVKYLLGPRYVSLRKAFHDVNKKEINREVNTVMVSFGGDDSKNLTPKIVEFLVSHYPGMRKNIVIGSAFKNTNIKEIENAADGKTGLVRSPGDEGMKTLMHESDIAICSGGQTLYELARVGVPTVAVIVAGNQENNVNGWEKAGFIEKAGSWTDVNLIDNLSIKMRLLMDYDLRCKVSETGRRIVPGNGADKIIDIMEEK